MGESLSELKSPSKNALEQLNSLIFSSINFNNTGTDYLFASYCKSK